MEGQSFDEEFRIDPRPAPLPGNLVSNARTGLKEGGVGWFVLCGSKLSGNAAIFQLAHLCYTSRPWQPSRTPPPWCPRLGWPEMVSDYKTSFVADEHISLRRFKLFICSSKRNKKCIIKVQRMENVKIQQGRRVGGWSSKLSIYLSIWLATNHFWVDDFGL